MESLQQIRKTVSLVVYGLISLVIGSIIVRIFLLVIGANVQSGFGRFIIDVTRTFVGPFEGIYPSINISNGKFEIEIFSVIALIVYVLIAYLIQKSINSVINTDFAEILSNILDSIFKILEFILITRFLLKLTGASEVSQFVRIIFEASNVFYEPFRLLMPGANFTIPSLNLVFETSTLIAIIIIIIFDSVSEGFIMQMKKLGTEGNSTPKTKQPDVKAVSQPQITINVPQQQPTIIQPQVQQPPTQYIDKRTIQVIQPQQSQPQFQAQPIPNNYRPSFEAPQQHNYPYANSNQMENNRPVNMPQPNPYNNQNVTPNNIPTYPN